MKVSPDRGRMKRKWNMDRDSGPCVLLCEVVLKKLIQHSWPCQLLPIVEPDEGGDVVPAVRCRFEPLRNRSEFGADFASALALAVRIVSDEQGVPLHLDGYEVQLRGNWVINAHGKVRPAPRVPF